MSKFLGSASGVSALPHSNRQAVLRSAALVMALSGMNDHKPGKLGGLRGLCAVVLYTFRPHSGPHTWSECAQGRVVIVTLPFVTNWHHACTSCNAPGSGLVRVASRRGDARDVRRVRNSVMPDKSTSLKLNVKDRCSPRYRNPSH